MAVWYVGNGMMIYLHVFETFPHAAAMATLLLYAFLLNAFLLNAFLLASLLPYPLLLWYQIWRQIIFKREEESLVSSLLNRSVAKIDIKVKVTTWIGHLPYLVSYFSGATLFARFKKPSHLFPRSVFRWQCGVWEMHDDIFARRWDFPLCYCHGCCCSIF